MLPSPMLPTARLPDNLPTPTNSIVLFVMLGLFVFGLMAFAKFTQQRERKRRDLIRVIPRDWGNLGSRRSVGVCATNALSPQLNFNETVSGG